jgi:predicted alpha/beta-fold hydrolase
VSAGEILAVGLSLGSTLFTVFGIWLEHRLRRLHRAQMRAVAADMRESADRVEAAWAEMARVARHLGIPTAPEPRAPAPN